MEGTTGEQKTPSRVPLDPKVRAWLRKTEAMSKAMAMGLPPSQRAGTSKEIGPPPGKESPPRNTKTRAHIGDMGPPPDIKRASDGEPTVVAHKKPSIKKPADRKELDLPPCRIYERYKEITPPPGCIISWNGQVLPKGSGRQKPDLQAELTKQRMIEACWNGAIHTPWAGKDRLDFSDDQDEDDGNAAEEDDENEVFFLKNEAIEMPKEKPSPYERKAARIEAWVTGELDRWRAENEAARRDVWLPMAKKLNEEFGGSDWCEQPEELRSGNNDGRRKLVRSKTIRTGNVFEHSKQGVPAASSPLSGELATGEIEALCNIRCPSMEPIGGLDEEKPVFSKMAVGQSVLNDDFSDEEFMSAWEASVKVKAAKRGKPVMPMPNCSLDDDDLDDLWTPPPMQPPRVVPTRSEPAPPGRRGLTRTRSSFNIFQ